ncbi:hypothetical protein SCARR_05661 [Pontiella sulfatireligans]|uniref:3',5'-cyclic adenosine monophosphate phosphodiesterase CpdA n=2 Tax=Pontiella sulfatireligans TaxID=2750658 RepID=A0A6C2UWI6_9BACT|nr:hypothetical protein SCARR_05661 [Pontiella sulfatireligans]
MMFTATGSLKKTSYICITLLLMIPCVDAGSFKIEQFTPPPYTHLNTAETNDTPLYFGFIGDHTGGGNPALWKEGLELLNQLEPEFIVSVGDLIAGKRDNDKNRTDPAYKQFYHDMWDEFEQRNSIVHAPFFYAAGNHDYWNMEQAEVWQERYGPSYYSFIYKDVLFVILNSAFIMKDNSDPKGRHFDNGEYQHQLYWLEKTLKMNNDVQWTFIITHHPFWPNAGRLDKEMMWKEIDSVLHENNRPYTVISGHEHRYIYHERFGRDYITLSGSGTGGNGTIENGGFNHVTTVTMKNGKPVFRNVLYDGRILDERKHHISDTDDNVPTASRPFSNLPPRAIPTPPPVKDPGNLIPNSSFEFAGYKEDSYPERWFLSNASFTRSNEEAATGQWSLKLETNKPEAPAIHQVYIEKGATYQLTASVKTTPESTGRIIVDTWDEFDSTAEFAHNASNSSTWKKYTGTFTNSSLDRMFIRIFPNNFSGIAYVDDVAVTQLSGPSPSTEDATFISASLPNVMAPGSTHRVSVQMKNTGARTWTGQDALSQQSSDAFTTLADISVVNQVVRHMTYTFFFDLTAPDQPGSYDIQWQMKKTGEPTGFGESTKTHTVLVSD